MNAPDLRLALRLCLLCVFTLALCVSAAAQDSCSPTQSAAMDAIQTSCADQPPNALCAGHPTVSTVSRSDSPASNLSAPGDRLASDDIDWFSVSSEANTWGMARLLFDAYAADDLDSETAALLAFGDSAVVRREGQPPPPLVDLTVSATAGANLRADADVAAAVIRTVPFRKPLKAIRRTADGSWIQVYAAPEQVGWVSASVVTGDIMSAPPLDQAAETVPLWQPWQRFDFRSGINDAVCESASESGILLQTPNTERGLRFWINGVDITLRGTAFLQAQVDLGLNLNALDGEATVAALGETITVPAGFGVSVALAQDAEGIIIPADAPGEVLAYDFQRMMRLPIEALHYPGSVAMDAYSIVRRRPADGSNPLAALTNADPCQISAPTLGANIRSAPALDAPVIALLGPRESATPLARAFGGDESLWWKLADFVWIRIDATVFGGDCETVPLITD